MSWSYIWGLGMFSPFKHIDYPLTFSLPDSYGPLVLRVIRMVILSAFMYVPPYVAQPFCTLSSLDDVDSVFYLHFLDFAFTS